MTLRMMRFVFFACLALSSVAVAAAAQAPLPLQEGEQLTYRVAWGIFGRAGEIKIEAATETNDGVPNLVVTTTTQTRGVLKRLFPFEARGESIFELPSGRLMLLTEASESGKKKTNSAISFNYETRTARYTDFLDSKKNADIEIPPGEDLRDLITSLVQTRMWELKPGEKRDINVVFEDDIYQLTVHALGYEVIETEIGRFNTLMLEPRMEKTPPKGMFRRGSRVHVWIAQDDPRRLPVRFEVEFKFGAGIATIEAYTPPGGAPPSAD
ncbi:MAG TPA: DUF3108 domain-containing protein [Opitutus sp.]|nr:DUF3108 domain-containing protein [Opitutus sp.]